MLDRFIRGSATRISPEAPVPVVEVNQPESFHLGGAGNVAANLAALGARPAVFGVVGEDSAADCIRSELKKIRVSQTGLLGTSKRPTTVKTRIIADHQHVVRADWESTEPLVDDLEGRLLRAFHRSAGQLEGVVLSDYAKGVLTETLLEELQEICTRQGLPVFVDLKKERRFEQPVALILINQRRAEEISGHAIEDDKSLGLVGRHLMARFPCSTLIVTRGSQGMAVLEKKTEHFDAVRTKPWEVFDVTGAGDTVLCTLTLALVGGATPREAATLANATAGVVVGKLGTAVCTPKELLDALSGRRL